MALATKQIVGPKSERMPTPDEEAKKRAGKNGKRGGYTNPKKRKENAEALASLPTVVVPQNSLFFGNEDAGRRFMVLYSLIATCERHDVNPEAYLADVVERTVTPAEAT